MKPENSKFENGIIPIGYSCPYTNKCGSFKRLACNGEGCPVAEGKITNVKFSCGAARVFEICEE